MVLWAGCLRSIPALDNFWQKKTKNGYPPRKRNLSPFVTHRNVDGIKLFQIGINHA
ncbi:hypothetical protein DESC_10069 [Desulfosarcina cetonica]|nr:hypothetical protein DESC_10069 [Desulfosarcina cetonica]